MIRRDAGQAVLDGRSFYAVTPSGWFTGTPFEAAMSGATNWIPPLLAAWLWTALTALVVFRFCHRIGLRGWLLALVAAATCSLQPLHATLGTGHHAALLVGLVLFDLWPPDPGPRWRRLTTGVFTGVAIAIEPTCIAFVVILLLARRLRTSLVALGTAAGLTVITAVVLPAMSVRYVLEVLPKQYGLLDFTGKVTNQSVVSAVVRTIGPSQNALLLGQVCAVLAAAAAVLAAAGWMRRSLNANASPNLGSTELGSTELGGTEPAPNPAVQAYALPFALALGGLAQLALAPIVTGPQFVWVLVLGAVSIRLAPVRIVSLLFMMWSLAVPWTAIDAARPREQLFWFEQLVATTGVLLLGAVVLASLLALRELVSARFGRSRSTPRSQAGPAARPFGAGWDLPERFRWAMPVAAVFFGLFSAATYLQPLDGLINGTLRTPDFLVYVRAAHAYAEGNSIYAYNPPAEWPFLYPPIAAVLAQPLGWLPLVVVQVLWTLLTVASLLWLTHRILPDRPRWAQGLLCCLAVVSLGPVNSTLGLGQISVLLMVLAIADVMPASGSGRFVGKGYLLGLATAIKLTPGAFIIFLWFTGRRRAAIVSGSVFGGLSLLGFALAPGQSWQYWTKIATGRLQFFPDSRGDLHNQSILSMIQRIVGRPHVDDPWWTVICALLTAVALVVGIIIYRRNYHLLGATICGMTSLLAVPVAWSHYYVWAYPLLLAIIYRPSPSSGLRAASLALVGWLVTQPFWTLGAPGSIPGNDQPDYEYVFNLPQHLVAGGSALLVLGVLLFGIVAIQRGRRGPQAPPLGASPDDRTQDTADTSNSASSNSGNSGDTGGPGTEPVRG